MNPQRQNRARTRRGRGARPRHYFRPVCTGAGLVAVYVLIRVLFPQVAELVAGLVAALLERVGAKFTDKD